MAELEASLKTPLFALHQRLGGRMVPFAGYAMPVQYPAGIMAEHQWTRAHAGLFDVSHMGQMRIDGTDRVGDFERLVPGDVAGLGEGRMRYTLLLNAAGGIEDDLMVTRRADHLFLVVNASNKAADAQRIEAGLGAGSRLTRLEDRALLALQGPEAATVLARFAPGAGDLAFMSGADLSFEGTPVFVTRSGYTGEDGYEISVPAERAEAIAERLLAAPEVKPIGLGARDSLRLEAGLCLHGNDIGPDTTPVEADLAWAIQSRRREAGDFPGSAIILKQLAEGAARKRVGIRPLGKAPARAGTAILDAAGNRVGVITSGGFGPTANAPIAMGYVDRAALGGASGLALEIRGQAHPAAIAPLPFVPHRYHRSTSKPA